MDWVWISALLALGAALAAMAFGLNRLEGPKPASATEAPTRAAGDRE